MLTAESTAIHDTPATKAAASATAGSRARPNITMAIAVPTVPAKAGMSAPKRRCRNGSVKAPATAPTPIAPNRRP